MADKVRSMVQSLAEDAPPLNCLPDGSSCQSGEAEAGSPRSPTAVEPEDDAADSADPEAQERPTLRAAGKWSSERKARMVALTQIGRAHV